MRTKIFRAIVLSVAALLCAHYGSAQSAPLNIWEVRRLIKLDLEVEQFP